MNKIDQGAMRFISDEILSALLKPSFRIPQKNQIGNALLLFNLALSYFALCSSSSAQIIPDNTLPVNSVVTLQGNTNLITGGTTAGGNLFHSFREFSLGTGNRAYFNNALSIENIITRVTGSSVSNIDGLIRANGSANLFLLNPNGILFGPNAALNIGGSFLGTTAESIQFSDGNEFSATNPQGIPLLSINVPIGLQFGTNPGTIRVEGTGHQLSSDLETGVTITENRPVGLAVRSGETLALVGGSISLMGGNLTAAQGRIELGSVASGSLVNLSEANLAWQLGYAGVDSFQDIRLSGAASVDVSGAGAGNIQVQARQLTLSQGSIILALTEGAISGGSVTVNTTDSVELMGTTPDGLPTSLLVEVQPDATGNAGDLRIETARLIIRNGGQLSTVSLGGGNGGNLTVVATDLVESIGTTGLFPTGFGSYAFSTGNGGNLRIETARLIIRDSARMASGSFGAGDGGDMTLVATDFVEVIGTTSNAQFSSLLSTGTTPSSTGDGGNLRIETGRLIIRDGAQVSSSTAGAGDAGTLTVIATDFVELISTEPNSQFGSSLIAGTRGDSTGNGGNLSIKTPHLSVQDTGRVSVSSDGSGAAGNLVIDADSVRLSNSASLRAETLAGNESRGNITVNASDIQLRRSSNITTNARGSASGGNIAINTDILAALENSDISANAENARGGQVLINAQGIFGTAFRESAADTTSDITASSALGASFSGTVSINTPDIDPSSGLVELATNLIDVNDQVSNECADLASSSFALIGRGGLPPTPFEALDHSSVLVNLATPVLHRNRNTVNLVPNLSESVSQSRSVNLMTEAQGWVMGANGAVMLVAEPSRVEPGGVWYPVASCSGRE